MIYVIIWCVVFYYVAIFYYLIEISEE